MRPGQLEQLPLRLVRHALCERQLMQAMRGSSTHATHESSFTRLQGLANRHAAVKIGRAL